MPAKIIDPIFFFFPIGKFPKFRSDQAFLLQEGVNKCLNNLLAVLSIQFRLLLTSLSQFARCIVQLVSTNAAEGDEAGHTGGDQMTC